MKKYLFSTLLFVNSFLLTSQSFNVAEHNGSTRTFNMVGINNKSFYLIANRPLVNACFTDVYLIGRDYSGNKFMNLHIATGSYMNYAEITVSEKKTLLVYAGTAIESCDYGGSMFQISEIDTLGNVLWSNTKSQMIDAFLPLASGNRIMITSDAMYRLSGSGQTLSTYTANYAYNYSHNYFNSTCTLNNGNILLSYQNSLREIDTLGNQINSVTIGAINELIQTATGNIYGISASKKLLRLSSSYAVIDSTTISNFSVNAYCYKNDSIYVVGNEPNLIPKYILLDTAFNVLHQSTSNLEQVVCTGIAVDDSYKIKILSYGASVNTNMDNFYTPFSHNFSGYFHTNILGDLNGTKDIGIVNVQMVNGLIYNSSGYPFPKAAVKVTVKNFGASTIKNFKLNHYAYFNDIAPSLVGLSEVHNFTLLPGDTISVVTGTFNAQLNYSPSNQSYYVCMFTTVPDSTNDYDVSNNQMCIAVTAVGIQKYSQEPELNIFPNPSKGLVNVHAEKAIDKIEVFDYSGKQIGIYLPNTATFELKDNTLASGLYVFKITTANYTAVRKVMIE